MKLFAIADVHLSFTTSKPMDIFSDVWKNHAERLAAEWSDAVSEEDAVLIPGDISWAMYPQDAVADLRFLSELPGKKILLRGNHDYWWNGASAVRRLLPEGMMAVQNDSVRIGGFQIGGSRGWTVPPENAEGEDAKLFQRECIRMELSLRSMTGDGRKIVMTHFPPFPENGGTSSRMTEMFERYGVEKVVYGHLHGPAARGAVTGVYGGIEYRLVAADAIGFRPVFIAEC